MNLYPHNQEAYQNVMQAFQTNQRACVVHATGTGKSFLTAAVASNFKKVAIIAPSNFILGQNGSVIINNCCASLDMFTYSALMKFSKCPAPMGFDLIVFDEFHRMGAEGWGAGCKALIDANPDAKIFGTSATPVRHLEQRNMADEIFDGNVVSEITLPDAWARRILLVPTYVIGMTTFESINDKYRTAIIGNKKIDESTKRSLLASLDNLSKRWENSDGVPKIISKYIGDDIRRMIVFAPAISRIEAIKESLVGWFEGANKKIADISVVNSAQTDEENGYIFKAFQDNEFEGIKIIISVDMLNEGIHIPNVDACILLRSTISKNIFMQQIGRCFSTGSKVKPVILDLADNITSTSEYDGLYIACERYKELRKESDNDYEFQDDIFTIDDRIADYRELCTKLDQVITLAGGRQSMDLWNVLYPEIKSFYDKNGRVPSEGENRRLRRYISNCLNKYNEHYHPERLELLEQMGLHKNTVKEDYNDKFEKYFKIVNDFYEERGYIPRYQDGKVYYSALNLFRVMRKKNIISDEQEKKLASIGITKRNKGMSFDEAFEFIKKKKQETGELVPVDKFKIIRRAYTENNEKRINMLAELGYPRSIDSVNNKLFNKRFDELKEYYEKNHKVPDRGTSLGNWAYNHSLDSMVNSNVYKFLKSIGYTHTSQNKLVEDNKAKMRSWIDEHGIPSKTDKEIFELYKYMCSSATYRGWMMSNGYYSSHRCTKASDIDWVLKEYKDYVDKNGHAPKAKINLSWLAHSYLKRFGNNDQYKDKIEELRSLTNKNMLNVIWKKNFDAIVEYVNAHGSKKGLAKENRKLSMWLTGQKLNGTAEHKKLLADAGII